MRLGISLLGMNILFNGGKDQVVYNLLHGFSELGAAGQLVIFVYDYRADTIQKMLPGAEIVVFKRRNMRKIPRDAFLTTFVIPHYIKKLKIDVFFFPMCGSGFRKYDIPTVVLPHDIQSRSFPQRFSPFPRFVDRVFYGMDFWLRDGIVAISTYDQNEISKFYPGSAHKIVLIPNPIMFYGHDPIDTGIKIQKPYILTINIAFKHKNIMTLLKAFNRIYNQIPHNLVLAGRAVENEEELQQYVEKHHLLERVVFTGYVEQEQMAGLLKNAELYVTPSLYEGFGMTAAEAMGAGVPVVCSQETALPETTLGRADYYEPADDSAALAEKILKNLNQPPQADLLNSNARAVQDCYDYRIIAKRYWRFFQSLLSPDYPID